MSFADSLLLEESWEIFIPGLLSLLFFCYLIYSCLDSDDYIEEGSSQDENKPVSDRVPVIPKWLENIVSKRRELTIPRSSKDASQKSVPETTHGPLVKIMCKPSSEMEKKSRRSVVNWCQTLMISVLGRQQKRAIVPLPIDTCLISVPMENFKCTDVVSCTFEPTNRTTPDSYFKYEMLDWIQIVTYVEDGKEYVAGYTIYIPDPCWCVTAYSYARLRKLHEGIKYPKSCEHEKTSAVPHKFKCKETKIVIEEEPLLSPRQEHTQQITKSLKSEYCTFLKERCAFRMEF